MAATTLAPTAFLGAKTLQAPLALRPLSLAAAPAAPTRRSALRVSIFLSRPLPVPSPSSRPQPPLHCSRAVQQNHAHLRLLHLK